MMPSNTPPPDDEKAANADEASQQSMNPFARHNLLLQLMETRQPKRRQFDHQQHEPQGTNDGATISNLNENMAGFYHHYQHHGSLQHQQSETAQAHNDASYRDAMAQMHGLPQQPHMQDMTGYHHYQQHGSLQHQQHGTAQARKDASYRDAIAQMHGLPQQPRMQDMPATPGSAFHQFHGANLQTNSLGQFSNRFNPNQDQADDLPQQPHMQDMSATPGSAMPQLHGATLQTNSLGQFSNRFNPNQPHADDGFLSMILMANRQVNAPSVYNTLFNTLLNTSEHGESTSTNHTDTLRGYNQRLTQALIASANPQEQNFGEAAAMPPQFLGAQTHLPGLRPTNMMNNPQFPSMYHAASQAGHDRGIGHDQQFGEGGFPAAISERIQPSAMGNSALGRHAMSDIPHGIQQQRLLEVDGGEKRPDEGSPESGEAQKSAPTRKKRRAQRKKPIDMPRRPLSAYNLFFSAERERILKQADTQEGGGAIVPERAKEEKEDIAACQALQRPLVPSQVKRRPHRKTHGKIGFRILAQTVGQRWRQLSVEQKKHYQDMADTGMVAHKNAMEEYYKKQNDEKKASHSRGDRVNISFEEWTHKADTASARNDVLWEYVSKEEKTRRNDLDTLSSRGFWQSLPVKEGFQDMIKNVLPGLVLWEESMQRSTKKNAMAQIIAYLRDVLEIADKKKSNNLSDVDVSRLNRWDVLAIFVRHDKTEFLSRKRAVANKRAASTKAVLATCKPVASLPMEIEVPNDDDDDDYSDFDE